MRTSDSYTAWSPCGWYLPSTSPTTRAHLRKGLVGRKPRSCIAYRMRLRSTTRCVSAQRGQRLQRRRGARRRAAAHRWTGFSPSRTSGNARPTMTDMAYARYEVDASWLSSMSDVLLSAGGAGASAGPRALTETRRGRAPTTCAFPGTHGTVGRVVRSILAARSMHPRVALLQLQHSSTQKQNNLSSFRRRENSKYIHEKG